MICTTFEKEAKKMKRADKDGNYRTIKTIGQGTYSQVYQAIDQRNNQIVALKRVKIRKAEDGIPKEFVREVEALQRFSHANIITISEVFIGKSNINIVYEYCDCDLEQLMNRSMQLPFTLAEIRTVFRQLVLALDQLHQINIMHRDLKPSNLFLKRNASEQTVTLKLADFGQARVLQREGQV